MDRIGKTFALTLTLIFAISSLSVLTVEPAKAQSANNPSAPEFTVKYADHSYDIPPKVTTTTDPYTGKTTSHLDFGRHVRNTTLDFTIKNQEFPSTVNGKNATLHYYIYIKGHFEEYWSTDPITARQSGETDGVTVLSIPAQYKDGSQLDIRVQANLVVTYVNPDHPLLPILDSYLINGDFSNTQTLTIPNRTANIQIVIVAVLVIVGVAVAGLSVYLLRRHARKPSYRRQLAIYPMKF